MSHAGAIAPRWIVSRGFDPCGSIYGFVALYNAANQVRDRRALSLDRWTLYLGSWLPYL